MRRILPLLLGVLMIVLLVYAKFHPASPEPSSKVSVKPVVSPLPTAELEKIPLFDVQADSKDDLASLRPVNTNGSPTFTGWSSSKENIPNK